MPKPDLCIFLDISPTDAAARGGFGDERYETSEMQKRVRALFEELLRRPQNNETVFVNAGKSIETVHETMLQLANELFEGERLSMPLKNLGYH